MSGFFRPDLRQRAEELVTLYPRRRSATLPLLHLVQEQDGYVSEAGVEAVADLTGTTPAEVRGTASFYDMFHLEPVGRYVVGVCTNVACLLSGGLEMLEHAGETLGCAPGGTSSDGVFSLEESECLADCNFAPCVQVNYRYVRTRTPSEFDALVDDLRAGRRDQEIPPHGTLSRVKRHVTLRATKEEVAAERRRQSEARAAREAAKEETK
jgi:NADH-quinone oxidoreductase E subunit